MLKYIFKRILMLIPVVLGVTVIVFFILSLTPGDPVKMMLGTEATEEAMTQLRTELGLDKPLLVQYCRYIFNLLKGDFGRSYNSNRSVSGEIMARFPITFKLALYAMLISVAIALPLGIIAAIKQYSILDNVSMLFCLGGISMPNFWFGLLGMLLFSLKLDLLPSSGIVNWTSYILPSFVMSLNGTAAIARMTRSSMLEVIRQDYIRTAKAKGVKARKVITKHALKNALLPIVTMVGLQFGYYLGGAVMIEAVFTIPGLGQLMLTGIRSKDVPMVLGCIVVVSVFASLINLLVDIIYGFIDPRIKAAFN